MIGNHDARQIAKIHCQFTMVRRRFLNYRVKFIGEFIVLDTVNDAKISHLCEIRLRWLRHSCLKPNQPVVMFICLCTPTYGYRIRSMDAIGLVNSEDFIALLHGFKHIGISFWSPPPVLPRVVEGSQHYR